MWTYRLAGLLGAGGVLLLSSVAQAQCSKDTDCKGNRICEAGVCTAAPTQAGAPDAAPAAPPAQVVVLAPQAQPPTPVKGPRHSTAMMVGGIVMVSFAPIALITSAIANVEKHGCEDGIYGPIRDCDQYNPTIYGGLIAAGALVAIGIPLIVIGAKRDPVGTATVTPWATPHGGGLGLRIDL
jgi:hypothetical protein